MGAAHGSSLKYASVQLRIQAPCAFLHRATKYYIYICASFFHFLKKVALEQVLGFYVLRGLIVRLDLYEYLECHITIHKARFRPPESQLPHAAQR